MSDYVLAACVVLTTINVGITLCSFGILRAWYVSKLPNSKKKSVLN